MNGLRVEREGPVLRVTLARPERRNAFDAVLIQELTMAFGDVGDARIVVLADVALRIGLVHEVADDLDAAVGRIVAELLTAGPEAVRNAKRLVLERPDGEDTAHRIAARRTSAEGQEGLRAFLERRKPDWAP